MSVLVPVRALDQSEGDGGADVTVAVATVASIAAAHSSHILPNLFVFLVSALVFFVSVNPRSILGLLLLYFLLRAVNSRLFSGSS